MIAQVVPTSFRVLVYSQRKFPETAIGIVKIVCEVQ